MSTPKCACCGAPFTVENPKMRTPCCALSIHRICDDKMIMRFGKCFGCTETPNFDHGSHAAGPSSSSAVVHYIHHFEERLEEPSPVKEGDGSSAESSKYCTALQKCTFRISESKLVAGSETAEPAHSIRAWLSDSSEASSNDTNLSAVSLPVDDQARFDKLFLERAKNDFLDKWRSAESSLSDEEKANIIRDIVLNSGVSLPTIQAQLSPDPQPSSVDGNRESLLVLSREEAARFTCPMPPVDGQCNSCKELREKIRGAVEGLLGD
ncbi:hypothetical protein ACLMJK_005508 [Lecanora helva]